MTITFLVTALNEERKIEATVNTLRKVALGPFREARILLVNDGSTDSTGAIIEALASADPSIHTLHNPTNLGLGGAYCAGLRHIQTDHVIWVSGDDAESSGNLTNILSYAGQAEIVVPVLRNPEGRPWVRRLVSRMFTLTVNFLFGLDVGYYNGTVLHRTELIRSVGIETTSFAYQAEALIKLLKRGHTYIEVPYRSATYDGMFSNAMRPKNLMAVLKALARLYFKEGLGRYRKPCSSSRGESGASDGNFR